MAILMAKFKNQDWQEVDKTNPDSDYTEEEQKAYLEGEYRSVFGPAYLFKWVEEKELVMA